MDGINQFKQTEDDICYASLVFKTTPGYTAPVKNQIRRPSKKLTKTNSNNNTDTKYTRNNTPSVSTDQEDSSILGYLPLPSVSRNCNSPRISFSSCRVKEAGIQTEPESFKKENQRILIGVLLCLGITAINAVAAACYNVIKADCQQDETTTFSTTTSPAILTPKITTPSDHTTTFSIETIETSPAILTPKITTASDHTTTFSIETIETSPAILTPKITTASDIPCEQNIFRMFCGSHNATDCFDVGGQSGLYSIINPLTAPGSPKCIPVYCDMNTDGGGWTVFQRRYDGLEPFNRSWTDYEKGFGEKCSDHWLGNALISAMTTSNPDEVYTLRLDLEDSEGKKIHIVYRNFSIGDNTTKYMLNIGDYDGSFDDFHGLSNFNGVPFSTYDQDNDRWIHGQCSRKHGFGGWWWKSCANNGLNNVYSHRWTTGKVSNIMWFDWHKYLPLKRVEMKFKPYNRTY